MRSMVKYLHEHPITPRTDQEKKQINNRLKRIEGQVRGIQRMIEEERYCIDVLVQISAVQAALKKVGFSVVERHMQHCVSHAIKTEDSEAMIKELVEVLKHFTK